VSSRKILEGKFKFFPTCLPCAPLRHTAKRVFAECLIFGTRQTHVFAVCQTFTVCFLCWLTSKKQGCRVPFLCRVLLWSAHVCPRFSTRQISGHTANARFPIVIHRDRHGFLVKAEAGSTRRIRHGAHAYESKRTINIVFFSLSQ